MKPLKEATDIKHKQAERMPFNVKMFKGMLNEREYGWYLRSQLAIFQTLEKNFEFPHEGLKREEAVLFDLMSLGQNDLVPDVATREYCEYLKGLSQEDANAHIYLNYFENMMECMQSVRAIQKDEWADEVNKGFDSMTNIFKNLEGCLTMN